MKRTRSGSHTKKVQTFHGAGLVAALSLLMGLPLTTARAGATDCPQPFAGNAMLCKNKGKGGGVKNKGRGKKNRHDKHRNTIKVVAGSTNTNAFTPLVPGSKKIGSSFSKPGLSKPKPLEPHIPGGMMMDPATGRLIWDSLSGKDPVMDGR